MRVVLGESEAKREQGVRWARLLEQQENWVKLARLLAQRARLAKLRVQPEKSVKPPESLQRQGN